MDLLKDFTGFETFKINKIQALCKIKFLNNLISSGHKSRHVRCQKICTVYGTRKLTFCHQYISCQKVHFKILGTFITFAYCQKTFCWRNFQGTKVIVLQTINYCSVHYNCLLNIFWQAKPFRQATFTWGLPPPWKKASMRIGPLNTSDE